MPQSWHPTKDVRPILESMSEPLIGRDDDFDNHNYQVREIFAQYGLTSYLGQVMEKNGRRECGDGVSLRSAAKERAQLPNLDDPH